MKIVTISVNDVSFPQLSSCIKSHKKLKGEQVKIDAIESKTLLCEAIAQYKSPFTIEEMYSVLPPWALADYVRAIYLCVNEDTLYLDHDVTITDAKKFLSQLQRSALEINRSTMLFNSGIIYNKSDCDAFEKFVSYWMQEKLTNQLHCGISYFARKMGFAPIIMGFTHGMYTHSNMRQGVMV